MMAKHFDISPKVVYIHTRKQLCVFVQVNEAVAVIQKDLNDLVSASTIELKLPSVRLEREKRRW